MLCIRIVMTALPDSICIVRCSKIYIIMRKIKKIVFIVFFLLLPVAVFSKDDESVTDFNWEPVMEAIIQVESGGDAKAVSGSSCGAMQITPILVKECNLILKRRKSKKRYTLKDRFSIAKSKEMFLLIQSYFNPTNDIEKAIRSWNGGIKYSVKRTQRYFEKVMKILPSYMS